MPPRYAVCLAACGGRTCWRRDGFARPYRIVLAFRHAAEAAGAVVREAAGVLDLERKGEQWHVRCNDGSVHRGPVLVNTAGAWGARLARAVGEEIPLRFSALMMIYTSALPLLVTPVVGLTGRPMSFKQAPSGHVVIGGGHQGIGDLDTGKVTLDVERLAFSARTALDLFPVLAGAKLVQLGGHRGNDARRNPRHRPFACAARPCARVRFLRAWVRARPGHGGHRRPACARWQHQPADSAVRSRQVRNLATGHRNPDQGCFSLRDSAGFHTACLLQPGQCVPSGHLEVREGSNRAI